MREPLIELGVINYLRKLCFKKDYRFSYVLDGDYETIEIWDSSKEIDSMHIRTTDKGRVEIHRVTNGCLLPGEVVEKQSEIIEIVKKIIGE